jgi:hypothetical protein
MGGPLKFTPLKLALNSAQRIFNVLGSNEGSPPPFQLDKNQWTWRARIIQWEANRRFLSSRKFVGATPKTPLFRDLEDLPFCERNQRRYGHAHLQGLLR